ncbi:unnamed protein product, partial [Scytosiphon promiscuus]
MNAPPSTGRVGDRGGRGLGSPPANVNPAQASATAEEAATKDNATSHAEEEWISMDVINEQNAEFLRYCDELCDDEEEDSDDDDYYYYDDDDYYYHDDDDDDEDDDGEAVHATDGDERGGNSTDATQGEKDVLDCFEELEAEALRMIRETSSTLLISEGDADDMVMA